MSILTLFSCFPQESFGENIQYIFFLAQRCKEEENKNLGKNNLKIGTLKKNWHLGQCPSGDLVRLFLCVLYFSVASQNCRQTRDRRGLGRGQPRPLLPAIRGWKHPLAYDSARLQQRVPECGAVAAKPSSCHYVGPWTGRPELNPSPGWPEDGAQGQPSGWGRA